MFKVWKIWVFAILSNFYYVDLSKTQWIRKWKCNFCLKWSWKWQIPNLISPLQLPHSAMYPRVQTIWGHIWKHTVKRSKKCNLCDEKSRMNYLRAHLKHILDKSQTNATNATMPLLRQVIWGDIWKHLHINLFILQQLLCW